MLKFIILFATFVAPGSVSAQENPLQLALDRDHSLIESYRKNDLAQSSALLGVATELRETKGQLIKSDVDFYTLDARLSAEEAEVRHRTSVQNEQVEYRTQHLADLTAFCKRYELTNFAGECAELVTSAGMNIPAVISIVYVVDPEEYPDEVLEITVRFTSAQ